jgi:hypothetical protein
MISFLSTSCRIKEYDDLVTYEEIDTEIFLKIIIPSREATKQYLTRSESHD